jgi:ribose transport system permease protein
MLRSQMRNIAPFLTLICLFGFFAAASPSFATLDNLGNILTQISVTGIIAVGLTFVILCAEIDLSIAAIANVTGIAVAYFTLQDSYVNIANVPMPGWAAILLALALCALLGLVNAFGLTVIGIPSFIMTLAMMQIAAGVSALLVRGQIAYKVPPLVTTLGSTSIGGIPWIVIVAALMLLGGHLVLTYTRFGRYVYMVGGNREAAEYSGLNVKLILGSVMVISACAPASAACSAWRISAARSRTSSTPICWTRSPPSWSAAPACSAAAAASATPSSACSCSASSTTASTTSTSTAF